MTISVHMFMRLQKDLNAQRKSNHRVSLDKLIELLRKSELCVCKPVWLHACAFLHVGMSMHRFVVIGGTLLNDVL